MKMTYRAVCSLAMWALVGATNLLADTHYVSLTGSSLWPYASWGSASTNIQDAVDTAVSGDTVLIGDGRYLLSSTVVLNGKSITLKSANGAKAVTIDGQYPALSQRCILVQNVTNAIIMGFTIANGCTVTAGYGGGVSFSGGGYIQNCVFTNNRAATGSYGGGGLLAVGGCAVVDCSFLSNNATGGGGGAWVEAPSSVESCVFVGNSSSAGNGGALYITGGGGSGPRVRNCLLYSNHSAYDGGGVYGQGVLENCTIASNRSNSACGGVSGNWNLRTYNCIIFFNTAPTSPNYSAQGYFYSCCTTPQVPDSQGSLNFTLNPLFVNVASNDFRLRADSQCVNTGNNDAWMSNAKDLAGNPRIVGAAVDRGAYEYVAPPYDIDLSNARVNEGSPNGSPIGVFNTSDSEISAIFTYTLVAGTGSEGNGYFTISESNLWVASLFDYETKTNYTIRVQSMDQGGRSTQKVFAITILDVNESPTNLALSNASIQENQPVETTVGAFSTTDPDTNNTFTYTLVDGAGGADNAVFAINGSNLNTLASFNYETTNSYSVRVRTTDQGDLWYEKSFAITVLNITDEFTLAVTALNGTVAKNPDAAFYDEGASVTLTATQSAGHHFTEWDGDATGTNNPQNIFVTTNLSVTGNFTLNVITVLPEKASVSVPEGGTTNFQVKLSAQPTGDTVVVVAWTAGDTDITPIVGTSLIFATNTWDAYQTVTLAASEDADNQNGAATITCSGVGVTQAVVTATEIDDDCLLTVTAMNGTVANNPDSPLYENGTEVTLTATDSDGYHFTGWTGDAAGTSNPVTVVMTGNKDVTANFALNVITILTDRASVVVPEGATAEFQVKLSAQPTGATVVAVGRTTGDTDISVSGGASLTFSSSNWATYQTVTLTATEDNDDNLNGSATITCSGNGITNATVAAAEIDDDYTLTVTSLYGAVTRNPDTPYYDNGTEITLTATPFASYIFTGWTGELPDTNNPVSFAMDGNKLIVANYCPTTPEILPPSNIGKKTFTARWKWVDGGAPEGELSVILDVDGFPQFVSGYETRYVMNSSECLVTNLVSGQDYWYRIRRILPDATASHWSPQMKVRTGKGIPLFINLLSDAPVSKGLSQEFVISNMVAGAGTLTVKSSNTNAVKAGISGGVLTLQYLWKAMNTAKVTLTLTHPATGYKVSYGATLSRAWGSVAIVGQSPLTNDGTRVVQDITLENRTGVMVYGVRVRAKGLDQTDWLINQTGLDPVSKAAIREIPCILPAGSQMVVRLVYNVAYKKQSKTNPVAYGAWAIMTPINGGTPVNGEMTITQTDLYDGLWLLGLPANRNRLYTVFHSDDNGATWILNVPVIRATANYLMWLDIDEGAPADRLYRVKDVGM